MLTGSESGEQKPKSADCCESRKRILVTWKYEKYIEAFRNSCFIIQLVTVLLPLPDTELVCVTQWACQLPPTATERNDFQLSRSQTSWLSNGCLDFQERRRRLWVASVRKRLLQKSPKSAEFCSHPDSLKSQIWCCVRLPWQSFSQASRLNPVQDASRLKRRFLAAASVSPCSHHRKMMSVVDCVLIDSLLKPDYNV